MASASAVRRLTKDYERLIKEPIDGILAAPLPENILEWHYVIIGSPETPYEGGMYHGRLLFQPDFPWKPPAIYMTTPNGRFEVDKRLCLSISDYHPESWNPGWSVGAILLGVQSFMSENAHAAGAVYPPSTDAVKRNFASHSFEFNKKNVVFCRLFPDLCKDSGFSASASRKRQESSDLPTRPLVPVVSPKRSRIVRQPRVNKTVKNDSLPAGNKPEIVEVIDLTDD